MIRFFRALMLAVVLTLIGCMSAGCTPSTQDRAMVSAVEASNSTAAIISGLQSGALAAYQLEQDLAVAQSYDRGDTKGQAIARVYAIRKSWEPVWIAFEALRIAHQTTATLISTADTTAEQLDSARAVVNTKIAQVRALLADARARVQ